MKTINIAGSIKELMIYDDPVYCGESYYGHGCRGIGEEGSISRETVCNFFFDEQGDRPELRFDSKESKYLKCPQCKEAYQAQKEKDKQEIRKRNHRTAVINETLCTMSPKSALQLGLITFGEYSGILAQDPQWSEEQLAEAKRGNHPRYEIPVITPLKKVSKEEFEKMYPPRG